VVLYSRGQMSLNSGLIVVAVVVIVSGSPCALVTDLVIVVLYSRGLLLLNSGLIVVAIVVIVSGSILVRLLVD
jgi:hypothetical protein